MNTSIFIILAGQLVWGMNFLYNLLMGNEEGVQIQAQVSSSTRSTT